MAQSGKKNIKINLCAQRPRLEVEYIGCRCLCAGCQGENAQLLHTTFTAAEIKTGRNKIKNKKNNYKSLFFLILQIYLTGFLGYSNNFERACFKIFTSVKDIRPFAWLQAGHKKRQSPLSVSDLPAFLVLPLRFTSESRQVPESSNTARLVGHRFISEPGPRLTLSFHLLRLRRSKWLKF